ncbi:hypothetical protein ONZ45_g1025 [Pleurotus djamor]|nr:hypothetical protein ONZ45_g19129 [Pleurotus djamor]KAJ8522422.1 hypothetical protein ONZ45_g1025 [Pleurotus djamor]
MYAKALVALLAAASSALALDITSPSPSAYWVQNTSNIIAWTFTSSDPNPVDITVTHSNVSTLNGPFYIARGLDTSNGSFTVTNVTLRQGSGYVVNFVNSTGQNIFATSEEFDVRASGTTPASVSVPAPAQTATGSGSESGSGTGTATSSSTGTPAPSPSENGAVSLITSNLLPVAVSAAMALFGGIVAL